jgi:hypothetical protein
MIIFDSEIPFLVRFTEDLEKEEKHTVEQLKVRIMVLVG